MRITGELFSRCSKLGLTAFASTAEARDVKCEFMDGETLGTAEV